MPFKKNLVAEKNAPADQANLDINSDFIRYGARRITREDIQIVVSRADEIRKRFNPKGPLGRFIEDGRLLISIVKDYWKGTYRKVPFTAIPAITFSLLYILNPWDIFPDFIPILGQIDDASVFTFCLLLVERDLQAYKSWMSKLTEHTSTSLS